MTRFYKPAFLAFAAMMIAAVSMGQTAAPAANSRPPTRLAVVNIVQLFDQLDEKVDADRDIEKMKNTFAEEARTRQSDMEKLDTELKDPKLFSKESAEYKKLQDDALQKAADYQSFTQVSQQKMVFELRDRTALLYRKLNAAIAAYSLANDIALVFMSEEIDFNQARTPQDVRAMVNMRKVIYFHPAFDITRQIIEKMNTEYKLGGSRKP